MDTKKENTKGYTIGKRKVDPKQTSYLPTLKGLKVSRTPADWGFRKATQHA